MQNPEYDNEPVKTQSGSVQQDQVYSVSQWFGTLLLMFIPVVNIILLFVWAFSSKVNRNKKNWAVASLFIAVIAIVLLIVLYSAFIAWFNSLFAG